MGPPIYQYHYSCCRQDFPRLSLRLPHLCGEIVYRRMAEKQFWVTPTLAVIAHALESGTRDYESDARKRFIFPGIWATSDPKTGIRTPLQGPGVGALGNQSQTLARSNAGRPQSGRADDPWHRLRANNNHTIPAWSIHEELEVKLGREFGVLPPRLKHHCGESFDGASERCLITGGNCVCKRGNAYHPTKMALHGSLLLEDPGIFSHAGDELMIAYRLIQPEVMVPTIVSLQQRLETVRQGEIDRFRGRLGRLSPEQENAIELLTRGIINKILHPAMTVLKTASAENDSTLFVEIVHRIFNLGEKHKHEDPAQTVAKNIGPGCINAAV